MQKPSSTKERVWFEEYFVDFNATAAARRAKYKHPNVMGPRKKAKFADAIAERLDEMALSAEQALARLSEQAMGSVEPFIEFQTEKDEDPETGETVEVYTGEYWINLGRARDAGVLHLVKEVKQDKNVLHYDSGETETTYRTMVKLYDAQRALKTILDHHTKGPSGREDDPLHIKYITENRPEDSVEREEDDDSTGD